MKRLWKHTVVAVLVLLSTAVILAIIMPSTQAVSGEGCAVTGKVSGFKKLNDFVVYVETAKGSFSAPEKHLVMNQKGMEFIPHVMPVIKGTAVDFLNSDQVAHNVFSPDHEKFNLGTWPQGQTKTYVFDKELGSYTILCNVHPEMEGYVVVLQNSYFAVTDDKGAFSITGLPDGDYTLKTWHQKNAPLTQKVTVKDGKAAEVLFQKQP